MVYWEGLSPADATWKDMDELKLWFPWFNLEDKVGFNEGQLVLAEEESEEDEDEEETHIINSKT